MSKSGLYAHFDSKQELYLALLEDVVDEVGFPVLVSGGSPALATLRDLEFRGVSATVINAAHLAVAFDGQTLARSFTD